MGALSKVTFYLLWAVRVRFRHCLLSVNISFTFKIVTTMTKQEVKNQQRLDKAAKESSMTLKAQLNALNTDAGFKLKSTDKDGKVTEFALTKREHIAQNLGMMPHMSKKGVALGYTPATFAAAVDESLMEVSSDGKTKAFYAYFDRAVKVTVEDDTTGTKEVPLYTSEEADKKVKGESATSCKLYRKCMIDYYGWAPGLIIKVLRQSRQIDAEIKRAEKSTADFEDAKKKGLYMVENRDGKLVKVQVRLEDTNL